MILKDIIEIRINLSLILINCFILFYIIAILLLNNINETKISLNVI